MYASWEPPYCPLHKVLAPCLACLAPAVVAEITKKDTNSSMTIQLFFQQADWNTN